MGNVKVGDKVRSLVTQIDVRAGELYEVGRIDADGDVWVIDDVGDNWYLTSEEFETLPASAEAPEDKPAFKVGDRVRATDKSGGLIVGETYTVSSYASSTGIGRWVNLEGRRSNYSNDGSFLESSFEPALKIEAGKYYRTRDGRKVGPVTDRGGYYCANEMHYNSDGECGLEGRHHPDQDWCDRHDLIAEWVDEPVKAAAPVAVQKDTPELTVKLSFDAVDVTNAIKTTLLKTNQGYGFEIARYGDYVWVDTGKKAPIVLKATDVQAAA
ncbi:hypothetical protein [Ochrobactrum sp. S1502_03]|uniref:hypothetical protein n=1 Tax=Ochrobactrum sp. S1502_03 TaxID=3108451 RepID=UPI0037C6E4B8